MIFKIFSIAFIISIAAGGALFYSVPYIDNDPVMGSFALGVIFAYFIAPIFIVGELGIIISFIFMKIKKQSITNFNRAVFYIAVLFLISTAAIAFMNGWGF
ncbi:MAG: hypothetical protein HYY10_01175 [Candidatus Liptonbacteria bacterium]|nr:hypothetical protein [Candidatus Liptonbacteria bacterium]